MPRHIVGVDLALGDSGKGSVTDALVRRHKATLVVRYSGGPQCAHHVVTPEGLTHCFSQFGSGTLAGASTLLTKHVIVDPIRLINEGLALRDHAGITDPFSLIQVHKDCLVITPFHRALNQLREMARINAAGGVHGSCGVGVGEAVRHSLLHPDHALRVKHLSARDVGDRLATIRDDLLKEATKLRDFPDWEDSPDTIPVFSAFTDPNLIDAFCWRYSQFCAVVRDLNRSLDDEAVQWKLRDNDTIWEGAQGVLLDEDVGLHPYTTWSRVTLRNAVETLTQAGITDYSTLGITRCYATRHGAGPLPTEDGAVLKGCKEQHNARNQWQGGWRAGHLDLPLLRYSLAVAGRVDALAVTHLDRTPALRAVKGGLKVATSYRGAPTPPADSSDLKARARATQRLLRLDRSRIDYAHLDLGGGKDYGEWIAAQLGVPLGVASFGPTHECKVWVGA